MIADSSPSEFWSLIQLWWSGQRRFAWSPVTTERSETEFMHMLASGERKMRGKLEGRCEGGKGDERW